MKHTIMAVAALALFAFVGCDKGTPGGPGVTTSGQKAPALSTTPETFTLSPPGSAKLKQGEAKNITISIKRGKNFDEDVALKFEKLPEGVTVEPAAPVIKHGDSDAKVTIKAADDAALGEFTIKVAGHPEKGPDASHDLKITVEKK